MLNSDNLQFLEAISGRMNLKRKSEIVRMSTETDEKRRQVMELLEISDTEWNLWIKDLNGSERYKEGIPEVMEGESLEEIAYRVKKISTERYLSKAEEINQEEGFAFRPEELRYFSIFLMFAPKIVNTDILLHTGDGIIPEQKIVDITICRMRKKMAGSKYGIETLWGRGYRLVLCS